MVQGYCVKCRKKREMVSPKKTKVGKRNAVTGKCPKCGTKMYRFTK